MGHGSEKGLSTSVRHIRGSCGSDVHPSLISHVPPSTYGPVLHLRCEGWLLSAKHPHSGPRVRDWLSHVRVPQLRSRRCEFAWEWCGEGLLKKGGRKAGSYFLSNLELFQKSGPRDRGLPTPEEDEVEILDEPGPSRPIGNRRAAKSTNRQATQPLNALLCGKTCACGTN